MPRPDREKMTKEERFARREAFKAMNPKERRLFRLNEKQAHHTYMKTLDPNFPDYKLSRSEERDLADSE